MKTEIEKMIEKDYQNCHVPVLCKNKSYADAVTGRKADPKVAKEDGKVKFLSDGMQYVNQKLDRPIYHEFIWNEDRIIHHKVIRATRINKHGMDWEEVYHAMFYRGSTYPKFVGEGTPEYWLSDDRNSLFEEDTHNWVEHDGSVVVERDENDDGLDVITLIESILEIKSSQYVFDKVIDISFFNKGSELNFVFKYPGRQKAALRKWVNGEYKKVIDEFNKYHGLKNRRFGCEIEFTGISRDTAARVVARVLGTEKTYKGGVYNEHHIVDSKNRTWKIVRDASISPTVTANRQNPDYSHYKCELVTPILEYKDLRVLGKIVHSLEAKGAVVNRSCGMHVHVDVRDITAIQLRNIVNITACKEDMLCKALDVKSNRLDRWCRKTEVSFSEEINDMSRNNLSLKAIKSAWYKSLGYSYGHYNETRYHILNLHSLFEGKGIEFRLFNSTLDSQEVKANVILALSICCTGCCRKKTRRCGGSYRRYGINAVIEKKDMTSFINQLGIVGDEFKTVRFHLTKNMNNERMVA